MHLVNTPWATQQNHVAVRNIIVKTKSKQKEATECSLPKTKKQKKTQQKLDYTIQGDARAEDPTSADKSPFGDPNGDFDPFDETLISISIVPL